MRFRTLLGITALAGTSTAVACSDSFVGPSSAQEEADAKAAAAAAYAKGPTHEFRVVVDPEGRLIGFQTARIRSPKVGFVALGAPGRKLVKPPEALAAIARSLPAGSRTTVAYYEMPEGTSQAALRVPATVNRIRASFTEGYPEGWNPDTDPFTQEDHDAFVDAAMQEVTQIGNDALAMYAEDGSDPMGIDPSGDGDDGDDSGDCEEGNPVNLSASMCDGDDEPTTESRGRRLTETAERIRAGTAAKLAALGATTASIENDCGGERVMVGVAVVGVGVAVVGGLLAISAAAAPVAFTLGGISGMVLPAASTVIATKAVAIGGALLAGFNLGAEWGKLRRCISTK